VPPLAWNQSLIIPKRLLLGVWARQNAQARNVAERGTFRWSNAAEEPG
jgi:hypothetical protein